MSTAFFCPSALSNGLIRLQCKNVELKFKAMSLTFREKNAIAKKLANDSFIDRDKELLRKHLPQDKLLNRSPSLSRPDLSFDILFILLDFETAETIQSNRVSVKKEEVKSILEANSKKITSQAKTPLKKKFQKKRSIPTSGGQNLKAKTSEMLTQCIQTGSTAIAGCANWIKHLK
jgi:hypothetical protein